MMANGGEKLGPVDAGTDTRGKQVISMKGRSSWGDNSGHWTQDPGSRAQDAGSRVQDAVV